MCTASRVKFNLAFHTSHSTRAYSYTSHTRHKLCVMQQKMAELPSRRLCRQPLAVVKLSTSTLFSLQSPGQVVQVALQTSPKQLCLLCQGKRDAHDGDLRSVGGASRTASRCRPQPRPLKGKQPLKCLQAGYREILPTAGRGPMRPRGASQDCETHCHH